MNVPAGITDETRVNMTSKGQVLLPKAIRDKIGLIPGGAVRVGINDRGEVVVLPGEAPKETPAEKRARIEAAIEAVTGIWQTDQTTDEIMREIRGSDTYP